MEFSKKIFIVVSAINIFVIAFSCYMIWKTMDLTPLAYLIPAVAAETATGTGFYYNKAKAENLAVISALSNLARFRKH